MVTVPTYTQAMADAGELPSVGMDVIYHVANPEGVHRINKSYHGKKMKVVAIEEDLAVLFHATAFTTACDVGWIKPLIELINGKAYQFDYKGVTSVGICNTSEKYGTTHVMFETPIMSAKTNSEYCTNIQLLEVKS